MNTMLLEQLVADRRRSLEASAAVVRIQRGQSRRGSRRSPLARWRGALRRAPAASPAPAPEPVGIPLAALGAPALRHLTVVAERVSRVAAESGHEKPGTAA